MKTVKMINILILFVLVCAVNTFGQTWLDRSDIVSRVIFYKYYESVTQDNGTPARPDIQYSKRDFFLFRQLADPKMYSLNVATVLNGQLQPVTGVIDPSSIFYRQIEDYPRIGQGQKRTVTVFKGSMNGTNALFKIDQLTGEGSYNKTTCLGSSSSFFPRPLTVGAEYIIGTTIRQRCQSFEIKVDTSGFGPLMTSNNGTELSLHVIAKRADIVTSPDDEGSEVAVFPVGWDNAMQFFTVYMTGAVYPYCISFKFIERETMPPDIAIPDL